MMKEQIPGGAEQEISLLKQMVSDLTVQVRLLTEQNLFLTQKIYGRKSDAKLEPDINQLSLFDEAEAQSDPTLPEPSLEQITYTRKKQKGKREADFSGLPIERIVHELAENDRICPDCGHLLHACGHDVLRRELTVIPAQYKVTEHVQTVYACRQCAKTAIKTPMKKAAVPAPTVSGSGVASPSLVAHIANQKYTLALPLYRQEQEFARHNLRLSRQTMANWLIFTAEHWLAPIYCALKAHLLAGEVLHADETTVQVLKEEGKKPASKSYMWLYRTGSDAQHPIVLFEYQPNRKHENASRFLDGFKGFVHSDGYGAYHNLPPAITPVGCWAHVRRKFADILKSLPVYNKQGSVPIRGVTFCDALFALERDFADLSFEERRKARLKKSQPLMDEFFAWAQKSTTHILATPQSVTGKALAYALGERNYLENFLKDGRCELSNNRAERSIRPFTIGRKNWIFANTEKGATASALIYSIIETAKENHLKPYEYLKFIFESAPAIDLQSNAALVQLLPWNAPAVCRAPIQLTMGGRDPADCV